MKKAASAVTIIGGTDGPTSIFIAGKGNNNINLICRIRNKYFNWKNGKRRKRAERQVSAGAHSLQETVRYMQNRYGAVEADASYPFYEDRRRQMKYSLIQRERPELIGADRQLLRPADVESQDQEALRLWMKEVDAWYNQCMERMDQLPEDTFPIGYHLYVIDCGKEGKLEIEMEDNYGVMAISFSGNAKKMREITKDIYRYYGVTQEDIDKKSERYGMLIFELSQ